MPENSVKIILEAADKTKEAFESIKSSSQSLVSTLKEHWVAFGVAAAGAIYTVKKAFDFGKEIALNLNEIKRQAEMIGLTTEQYQKLSFAAKMSDVSNESLRIGMRGLSLSMAQFNDEAGDGYDILTALGLSARDAAGNQKPLNQMFMEIADKFSSYADGAAKVDYANRLMGRSGMELIPLLNKGREGIAAYGEELVKMGGLIGDVVVQKGSEAEDTFKRLEVKSNSLKIAIGALVLEFVEFGEKIGKAIGGVTLFSQKADEMDLANLKRWLAYAKEQGASLKLIEDYEKRIFELESKITKIETPSWIKEWVAGFQGKPEMPKPVTPPEPDWIKKWVEQWDALTHSFEQLGIQSQQSLTKSAQAAVTYVEQIKNAFTAGKATVNDYKNALVAATEAIQKATGEDTTKKLVDLFAESQKEIDAISKEDPDRGKKVQAIIDKWMELRSVITQSLAEAEAKYKENLDRLNEMKIQPGIDIEPAVQGLKDIAEQMNELRRQAEVPITMNVQLTGEGMSPPMPLGEAFDKFGNRISQAEADMNGLSFAVDFSQMTASLGDLGKKVSNLNAVFNSWNALISSPYASAGSKLFGMDPSERKNLTDQMSETMDQVFYAETAQLKRYIEWTDEELSAELWARFVNPWLATGFANTGLSWQAPFTFEQIKKGSFQTGIGYVPETGPYLLHKGERVSTTNQIAMGGQTIGPIIIQGAGDPKEVARQVTKALKYHLSGELRKILTTAR